MEDKVHRLNYIGSKFQLLDWITTNILEETRWDGFSNRTIADVFAGTGIVSYHFRKLEAAVVSNDAELYSSIITHAMTRSVYSEKCQQILDTLNEDLEGGHQRIGFVTTRYSPYESNERMFFTVENAMKIDYMRTKLEKIRDSLTEDEYKFVLASILIAADSVSNVPAVYGCFLKKFKDKATRSLKLQPIHTNSTEAKEGSKTHNSNCLDPSFMSSWSADLAYLDPPYNNRQYSKNYFPLNIIAKTPLELESEAPLTGKTGIPTDCFLSPFCRKAEVETAFKTLFSGINASWIVLSYSSESLVSKERMVELMSEFGVVNVIEKDYKRFKSFEYNKDNEIKEFLFFLKKF